MKGEICQDCICERCGNNSKNSIYGKCNECELCKVDGLIDEAQRCRDYIHRKDTRSSNTK